MNNQVIKVRNVQTINNIVEQTGRSPYIGENGNWFEFNDETQSFVDSGVVAQGIPGEEGKQGEKGEDGYTPIKGTDYFTEGDISEIVDIVTEKAIGDIDTILSTLTTVEEVSE